MVRGGRRSRRDPGHGIVELLLRAGVELEGAEIVVAGDLVGAPLSTLLAQDWIRGNATVTVYIKTRDPLRTPAARTSWWRRPAERSSSQRTWSSRARSWSTSAFTAPRVASWATWTSRT